MGFKERETYTVLKGRESKLLLTHGVSSCGGFGSGVYRRPYGALEYRAANDQQRIEPIEQRSL